MLMYTGVGLEHKGNIKYLIPQWITTLRPYAEVWSVDMSESSIYVCMYVCAHWVYPWISFRIMGKTLTYNSYDYVFNVLWYITLWFMVRYDIVLARVFISKHQVHVCIRHCEFWLIILFLHRQLDATTDTNCAEFTAIRWFPVANISEQHFIKIFEYYEPGKLLQVYFTYISLTITRNSFKNMLCYVSFFPYS